MTKLYNGEVTLDFNKKTHKYIITDGGKTFQVPSVTTVLKVLDKPALVQWAANSAIEYLREHINPGYGYDKIELEGIYQEARFNFRKISKKATDVGTLAHEWVENFLKSGKALPKPANEQAYNCCQAAANWLMLNDVSPIEVETKIYSRKYKYAGTFDLGLAQVKGELSIVDWKSSKAVYPEYRLQLAAYAQAYEEESGKKIHNRYIIRLGKDDGEFEEVCYTAKEQKKDFAAFAGAIKIQNRLAELEKEKKSNPTVEQNWIGELLS